MKRKLTAVVLSFALLVANLAACSDRNDSEDSESKVTETTTTTTTSETKEDTSKESTTTTEATTTTSKEDDSKSDESTTTTAVTDSSTTSNSTTTAATTKANDTTTTKAATTTKTTTAATTQSSSNPKSSNRVMLNVKNIQQKPELPTGCEITAAAIALNYYGIKVSKMELLKYVPISDLPKNGHGDSPWIAFIGNPKLTSGLGCYVSVIKAAIIDYFEDKKINDYTVKNLYKSDFLDLYEEIDNGNPVIVWATVNMQNITQTITWIDNEGFKSGWISPEHCLVLIGYDKDKNTAIFSDPLDPKGTVEYPISVVEKAYNQLSKQALVIHKD